MTINYQRTGKRAEALNSKNIIEREALALTLLVNGVPAEKVASITKLPLREILFQEQREEVLRKKHWIEACQLEETLQALQQDFEIDKAFAETFAAGYKEFYDDHFADLQAKLQEQRAEPAPKPDQNPTRTSWQEKLPFASSTKTSPWKPSQKQPSCPGKNY